MMLIFDLNQTHGVKLRELIDGLARLPFVPPHFRDSFSPLNTVSESRETELVEENSGPEWENRLNSSPSSWLSEGEKVEPIRGPDE